MFEKIKDYSKIFVALGAVLYFFGFISMNSLLSRFGMVSFDVVNSRFIFAGFFSAIAVGASLIVAGAMAKEIPLNELFDVKKNPFWVRIWKYVKFFLLVNVVNVLLFSVFTIGKQNPIADATSLKFKHLFGDRDCVGMYLEKFNLPGSGLFDYSIKWALNISPILILVGLLLIWAKGRQGDGDQRREKAKRKKGSGSIAVSSSGQGKYFILVDLLIISVFSAMGFYCFNKMLTLLVDFNAFQIGFDLRPDILFAWFYPNVMLSYLFINGSKNKFENGSWRNIFNLSEQTDSSELLRLYVVPMIGALIIFGQVVFPRIPFAIGGGQPRKVVLETMDKKIFGNGNLYILGESSQFVFLVDVEEKGSKAYQVSKSEVRLFQTR